MNENSPAISAVICTRNRPDLIGQAVKSVLENNHPSFELLIIDQSDDDRTAAEVSACGRENIVRYVHVDRVGLSAAYNTAIALARGEILAFTDDDCVAPPNWLASTERAFQDPRAALLYGQVIAPADFDAKDGTIPELRFSQRRLITRREPFRVFGMGANFAAKKSLFETVGGFDEILGGGGLLKSSQDFDLQYRVYRSGLACLIEPSVSVTHYGIRTAEQWPATMFAYGVGDGGFYMKHIRCGDLRAARLLAGIVAGQALRSALKPILHRRHSTAYLRGVLTGARGSFRFMVERQARLYRPSTPRQA